MKDTPRTNAILTAILETHGHVGFLNCPPTWVAFSRELELELNAANDRIKRMEDAGDAMAQWLNSPRNLGGDSYLVHQWTKAKEAKP